MRTPRSGGADQVHLESLLGSSAFPLRMEMSVAQGKLILSFKEGARRIRCGVAQR